MVEFCNLGLDLCQQIDGDFFDRLNILLGQILRKQQIVAIFAASFPATKRDSLPSSDQKFTLQFSISKFRV